MFIQLSVYQADNLKQRSRSTSSSVFLIVDEKINIYSVDIYRGSTFSLWRFSPRGHDDVTLPTLTRPFLMVLTTISDRHMVLGRSLFGKSSSFVQLCSKFNVRLSEFYLLDFSLRSIALGCRVRHSTGRLGERQSDLYLEGEAERRRGSCRTIVQLGRSLARLALPITY